MSPQQVPGCEDIYYLDVPMFATREVNSPYVIDGPEPAIVDTGTADGVDELRSGVADLGIAPEDVAYIVPTHAHLDHAGGAGHLAEQYPNATVVCHENAVEYLTDPELLSRLEESVERAIGMPAPYGKPTVLDRERCAVYGGGETLAIGDRTLDVIDAPGHAPHQLCFYDRSAEVLFSADANGMRFAEEGHRPTTPPPNFDPEVWLETLDALESFDPETICYAHFGPGEIGGGVQELRDYREMLPAYVEMIADAREEHGDDVGAIVTAIDDRWSHWSLSTDVAGILHYLGED